ncbi:GntR family transcriptional regulator [Streptomyces sp. 71268]|uniref:GntR family transcriptional regulator n=1 Tax=Streptomyces sp. 71268 TaxID=3002640 RepID=UPI0023F77EF4|nr:GntR family transcriptional regulator [Streptomyces sp. 71268]WEV26684.1 GntR family transcriptional regulator [Streptomyces sp. 71268]
MNHLPDLADDDNRPLYAQISAALERAIEAGELEPGARVPGENVLIERYGVARETARKALEQLAHAGLIDKRRGSGTYVREQRKLERKPRRYRRQKKLGEFASDAIAAGRDPNVEATSVRVAATSAVARRLGVEPGSEVMKTEYVFKADGEPIQSSVSYEPLEVTGGTAIEFPEEGQYANAGVINRMDAIGVEVTKVSEEVEVRPPRSHEAHLLRVDPGVHVFCIRRTFRTDERVVETADIVIPGDRYSLNYEFRITDEDDPVTA